MDEAIRKIVEDLTEDDFQLLFRDIKEKMAGGKPLQDGPLARLCNAVQAEMAIDTDATDAVLTAVLYKMAGDWAEHIEADNQSRIEGWKAIAGKLPLCELDTYVVVNEGVTKLWDVLVAAGSRSGPPLGFFPDENSAKKFVAEHGYVLRK